MAPSGPKKQFLEASGSVLKITLKKELRVSAAKRESRTWVSPKGRPRTQDLGPRTEGTEGPRTEGYEEQLMTLAITPLRALRHGGGYIYTCICMYKYTYLFVCAKVHMRVVCKHICMSACRMEQTI